MILEEVLKCPVCEGGAFKQFQTCKDYTTTGELFHVKQCMTCELLITSPRPPGEYAHRYYESKQYISHAAGASGLFDSIYLVIRRLSLRWKFSLIKPFLNNGPILDYGCGTGGFLKEAMKNNCKIMGVEPSTDARAIIDQAIPVVSTIDQLPDTKFDVITLWHVLEHVYNLEETLKQLKSRLADRGTIFIAVPNWQSHDARHYQEKWAAYDVPRHLWHFSKGAMTTLLKKQGLRISKIIPMKLDAYYVSMLSEKYSHGNTLTLAGVVSATRAAFISNIRGKSENNQSSLIFVVQE